MVLFLLQWRDRILDQAYTVSAGIAPERAGQMLLCQPS
jgi:hypothetical protein